MTVTSGKVDTSTERASAPLVIVSCDTHIGPRLRDDLRPYCPPDFLDDFDAYAGELQQRREAAAAAKERVAFGGKKMGAASSSGQSN